jgi:hypothetical protein
MFVVVAGCGSAWADGFVLPVKVPRVHGSLASAYRVLAFDGFRVSLPRGVVIEHSLRVVVSGERPAAGSLAAPGSTVRLGVACCKSHSVATASSGHAVGLIGDSVPVAESWAERHHVAWRVMLGPLKRAMSRTLLGNYVVRRAVLVSGRRIDRDRAAGPVLVVRASQRSGDIGTVVPERVPACEPVPGAKVLVDSALLVLVENPGFGPEPAFAAFVACDRTTGRQELLYGEEVSGDGYYYTVDGTAASGDAVALAVQFGDKYNDCSSFVEIYDFASSSPLTSVSADCADVWSLVVDDEGFAAWLEPVAGPGPYGVFVHDDAGTRQLDSGVIANLSLSGTSLTWTNNGIPRQATLS